MKETETREGMSGVESVEMDPSAARMRPQLSDTVSTAIKEKFNEERTWRLHRTARSSPVLRSIYEKRGRVHQRRLQRP